MRTMLLMRPSFTISRTKSSNLSSRWQSTPPTTPSFTCSMNACKCYHVMLQVWAKMDAQLMFDSTARHLN